MAVRVTVQIINPRKIISTEVTGEIMTNNSPIVVSLR